VAERALELCGSLISGNKLDELLSGILAKTSVPQMFFKDDLTTEDTEKNKRSRNDFRFVLCFSVSSVVKYYAVALLCPRYGG